MTPADPTEDERLWRAVVDAERALAHHRAEFHRHARDEVAVLRSALGDGSAWQRGAALSHLRQQPADPAPVRELVELAMSPGWALEARGVLERVPAEHLTPALDALLAAALEELRDGDADLYSRWAELLVHVRAWPLLRRVQDRAAASREPEVREVAAWIADAFATAATAAAATAHA
ncbi:hypothetical protein [Streptomyces sp. NPDC001930]|uniref:hypothetical protein n=1 Tax=Streptomyces sp. NPDC001930 TaxID=3364625 RepID=UPI0036A5CD75